MLNRGDTAGFRLDSTFTHKQHKSICMVNKPELTTRSDYRYLNKYTALHQVSSYMFLCTGANTELCCGVVKAHDNFEKSPAQHAADLYMLEKQPQLELKEGKEALKAQEPTLFKYFEEIRGVRQRHKVVDLPKHVFMLVLCHQPGCPHPKCQTPVENINKNILQWYPGGPDFTYFLVPIADPLHPWVGPCGECSPMQCGGNFLKAGHHFSHYQKHGRAGMMFKPPSVVIVEKHRRATKQGKQLTSSEIKQLAKDVLLTEENVRMWLEHLEGVSERRKEGAKKAAQTRAKKKGIQPPIPNTDKTNICLCRFS